MPCTSRRAARPRRRRIAASCACEETAPSSFGSSQPVTHTAQRVEQLQAPALVNFLSQPVDVDLDEVRLAVKMTVPYVLDDFAARHGFGGAHQQKFEQCKF